jgi:hypothetical protein
MQHTPLWGIRLVVLASVAAALVLFAVLAQLGLRFTPAGTVWLALPPILGASAVVLVPAVGSTVRPLPYGTAEPEARRVGVQVVRVVTYIRFTVAVSPALFGLVGSLISHSLLPAAVGIGFTVLLHLLLVYPRPRVLAGVRERLESGGTASYLWDALGSRGRDGRTAPRP